MPTLPLWFDRCFSSQSMVSQASLLSSTSPGPFFAGMYGRASTNWPSDIQRPRTSW
jgi:hypothetical protein